MDCLPERSAVDDVAGEESSQFQMDLSRNVALAPYLFSQPKFRVAHFLPCAFVA